MPEADWDDVLDVIELLIDDGYEVADFTASTPEPVPEKRYTLEVRRSNPAETSADETPAEEG
jgi:hypothetical protein